MRRLITIVLTLVFVTLAACGPAASQPAQSTPTDDRQHMPLTSATRSTQSVPSTDGVTTASPVTANQWSTDEPTPAPAINPEGPSASQTVVATIKTLPNANIRILAPTFADASHGWMAAGQSILTTADGGQHWTRLADVNSLVNDLDFVSIDSGWAATEEGLLTTTDGGLTWQRVPITEDAMVSRLDFIDSRHGWVATGNRLLRTIDGGATWTTTANLGLPSIGLGAFSFTDPDSGWMLCGGMPGAGEQVKQLYKTENGGDNWRLIAGSARGAAANHVPNSLPTIGYVSDLYFLDDSRGWLTSTHGGLYCTGDGGLSWTRVAIAPNAEEFLAYPRFVSPEQGYIVSTQGRSTLLGTKDAGATWTRLYPDIWPTGPIEFVNAQVAYAIGTELNTGAILKSIDGGRGWKQLSSLDNEQVLALSFPDVQHGWAIANRWEGDDIVGSLYRTTDGGSSWTKLSETRNIKELYHYLSFIDAETGYISSGWGHLSVSHDGGATLQRIDSSDSRCSRIDFIDQNNGWKINDFRIHATTDGGITWTRVPLGYRVWQFDLLPDGHAWVTADDCSTNDCQPTLLSTADGGHTWTRHDLVTVEPTDIAFVDATHGWLKGNQESLYATEDGGKNWTQVH